MLLLPGIVFLFRNTFWETVKIRKVFFCHCKCFTKLSSNYKKVPVGELKPETKKAASEKG